MNFKKKLLALVVAVTLVAPAIPTIFDSSNCTTVEAKRHHKRHHRKTRSRRRRRRRRNHRRKARRRSNCKHKNMKPEAISWYGNNLMYLPEGYFVFYHVESNSSYINADYVSHSSDKAAINAGPKMLKKYSIKFYSGNQEIKPTNMDYKWPHYCYLRFDNGGLPNTHKIVVKATDPKANQTFQHDILMNQD